MPTEQIQLTTDQTDLTAAQTELVEKLNCLEYETAQLNRAYQLWRSYVEQGRAPDWMAAAIRVTYDALIAVCLDISTILTEAPDGFSGRRLAQLEAAACEISGSWEEESATAAPSPELLPMMETEPDGSEPEMPVDIFPPSTGDTISEEPTIQQGQQHEEADVAHAYSPRLLALLKAAAWGGPVNLEYFAPSRAHEPPLRQWWAQLQRLASSPGAIQAILEGMRDTDVRPLLEQIRVPTLILHRRGDRCVPVEAGRYLAAHIPQARYVELPGDDHWWWVGQTDLLEQEIAQFVKQQYAAVTPTTWS